MSSFSIWAPLVESLQVLAEDGTHYPLTKDERGRWTGAAFPKSGDRYRLQVNGQECYPDPWSHFQPDGVHGASVRYSHSAPPPGTERALPSLEEAVIYELHIGTFSREGTFLGAISHLDHLRDLGVTHVEIMPIFAFPGRQGWGYDGVFMFAPHAPYGSPDDLKTLVAEAHKRNLGVLLDIVFNHLGPDGNYLGLYAPYSTDRYDTPWGQAINLDGPDSDLMRKMLIDCALYWLENFGFDGLRLDAVHALFDQSATHFLEELSVEVQELGIRLGRKMVLIAECDLNDPRYVRSAAEGGFGLDAQWCDDFHHALHAYFTTESDGYYEDYGSLALVAKALRQGYVFDGTWSAHRRRHHGRPPDGVDAAELVVCAQNHDQIGNRAQGERLASLLTRPQLFQISALTLLSPFVPMIFQGEEWGTKRPFLYFTDHQDPVLAKNVTAGRRQEFAHFHSHHGQVPDPQATSSFENSILNFDELEQAESREMYEWYKQLIALRSRLDYKREAEVHFDDEQNWLSYRCGGLVLVCNFSDMSQDIPSQLKHSHVLLSHPKIESQALKMPPHSIVIFSVSLARIAISVQNSH